MIILPWQVELLTQRIHQANNPVACLQLTTALAASQKVTHQGRNCSEEAPAKPGSHCPCQIVLLLIKASTVTPKFMTDMIQG